MRFQEGIWFHQSSHMLLPTHSQKQKQKMWRWKNQKSQTSQKRKKPKEPPRAVQSMTGHSHTMGAIPARGATTITRRKPAIPAIIAPSNKAPAHTKAICAGVPAAFQKGFQNNSSKASNPGQSQYQTGWKAKVCWFLVAHTTNQQVECDVIMEQWTHKPPQDHQVAQGGWAYKAKELLDAHQAGASQKVANLVAWQPGSFVFTF